METPDTVKFIEQSELVRKKALGGVLKWYGGQGDLFFLHMQKPGGGVAAFNPRNPANYHAM